ncbi:MAG TPA: 30S ribosomal protein S15 [Tepiditoga sp.]|nr:30S ribosomal protein S15 [Tepiditoga sp.]
MSRGLENDIKKDIIEEFKVNEKDTGSVEVQIALMSSRIKHLTEHLKIHKKDYHSRRGLFTLIGKRRKMLKYLKTKKPDTYKELIAKLGIRG